MRLTQANTRYLWIVILVFTVALHTSYVGGGFIGIDRGDIEQGYALRPLSDIGQMFTTRFGETGFYRPLVTFFDSFDAWLWGRSASGFHLTSILLHGAFAAAAYFFARTFFLLTQRESLFVMLVAGLHPLSWPVVGAVHYRSEQLVALFTLLAVSFYISARTSQQKKYIFLALLSFLAALFSKETAIVWVTALIIFWEFLSCRADRPTKIKWRFPSLLFLFEIAAVALYSLLRTYAVPELWRATSVNLPFSEALGTRLSALGWQFVYLISPLLPSLSDATPVVGISHPLALATLAIFIFAFIVLVRFGFSSLESRALIFLGLALAPALNIISTPRFVSPHYGYLATAGVGILFLIFWRRASSYSKLAERFFVVPVLLWILVATISTFSGGFRFQNDKTLFEPEVARDQNFLEGYYHIGNYYWALGDYENATRYFKNALARSSSREFIAYFDKSGTLVNLAGVRLEQNRFDEADSLLLEAENQSVVPDPSIIYNRALVASRKGDDASAAAILRGYPGKWESRVPVLLLVESLMRLQKQKEAAAVLLEYLNLLTPEEQEKARRLVEEYQEKK